jgi:tetratricopeptide (TPR) repeat protein
LYINLRGYSPMPPLRPIDALPPLLRALGVAPEKVPTEVDEAAALYRELLADRRVLVLLDNAENAEQVRPLLPPASHSLALVTSRSALGDLATRDGADQITLGVLSPEEARSLLARILGDQRVDAEPSASAELARLCSYLPLALRIVAANIGDHERISDYASKLNAGNRLAALEVEGDEQSAVRAVFDLSYAALSRSTQRMFRLLGLVPGTDVTTEAASSLADLPLDEAGQLLDELCSAHLINPHSAGRFAFHDLLRLHAAGHAEAEEDEPARNAAIGRLYEYYLHTARGAVENLYPGIVHLPLPDWTGTNAQPLTFADEATAMDWLDAERANLVVAVSRAAEHGPRPAAWLLASAVSVDMRSRSYNAEAFEVAQAGLAAAEAEHELRPQAILHNSLSSLFMRESQYKKATEHLTRLLDISRQTEWPEGISTALSQLAVVHCIVGRPQRALGHIAEAIALDRKLDWTLGLAIDLQGLALVNWELGKLDEAAGYNAESLALARQLTSSELTCVSLGNLAEVYGAQGRINDAREHLEQALSLSRKIGDRPVEADFLGSLAAVERIAGNRGRAFELAHTAIALAREIAAPRYELRALNVMAGLNDDLGRWPRAIQYGQTALLVADASANRYPHVQALVGLAAAHTHLGQHDDALEWIRKALRTAEESGYRMLMGQAHTVHADIHLGRGVPAEAVEEGRRALAVHRETGHRPGEADALALMASAYLPADPEKAEQTAQEALTLYTEMGIPVPGQLRVLAGQPLSEE